MWFKFGSKDLGVDLGTANTLIYLAGKGIVVNEPSVIASDNYTGEVLAVGIKAKEMLGKAPKNISVVRPLKDGVISDFDMTAQMLRVFIQKALKNTGKAKLRVVVGVPSGVTEVEKRAVEDILKQMGAGEVYILDEPMAAAIGAKIAVDEPVGCMIVDIGGGTSDIAVIALGGIVASTSIRYAGDKLNEAIVQYMRKTYSLLIGEKTAEELKIRVGCALMDLDEEGKEIYEFMHARGRDLVSGLPVTIQVSNKDMCLALEESIELIIDGIRATLEKTPPEIAADIAVNGIVLSGGGSMIKNLDKIISSQLGMEVRIAEDAFETVALGTGISLANTEKLKRYANNKQKSKAVRY